MILLSFSENLGIVLQKLKLIYADRLIAIFAGTDDVFFALNRCADDINLNFLFLLCIVPPPLPDIREYDREILCIYCKVFMSECEKAPPKRRFFYAAFCSIPFNLSQRADISF